MVVSVIARLNGPGLASTKVAYLESVKVYNPRSRHKNAVSSAAIDFHGIHVLHVTV